MLKPFSILCHNTFFRFIFLRFIYRSRIVLCSLCVALSTLIIGCCGWNILEERISNGHSQEHNEPASATAQRIIHQSPPIDLHADSLLWNRDLLQESDVGHADIPRWQAANFDTQVFSIVTEVPFGTSDRIYFGGSDIFNIHCFWNCWPSKTYSSRLQRALLQIDKFDSFVASSQGKLTKITNKNEFIAHQKTLQNKTHSLGGILSIEGAQALDSNLENLNILASRGVRILGLVHLINNNFAASSSGGNTDTGLSPLGEKLIRAAENSNITLDLAHSSPKTIDEALLIAKKPFLVTHTGLKGVCPNVRNLSDTQAKAVVAKGGIIGIAFFKRAVCGNTVQDVAKSIVYATRLLGAQSVALGSDFDGSVSVPIRAPEIPVLADALLQQGLTEAEIAMIFSKNVTRFFEQNLPALEAHP